MKAMVDTQISEENLITNAANGDLEAFNQLVLNYQDIVYHHVWTILRDQDQAADAAQESFIKAYRAIDRFRGGSFRAWIMRIAANTSYDYLRRNKRHPVQSLFPEDSNGEEYESPAWIVDTTPSVQSIVEKKEAAHQIYQMLDELPEIYRTPIILIDMYDFDYSEAAQTLKVPMGTLKSRLVRGRIKMQEKLQSSTQYHLPAQYQVCAQV